MISISFLTLTGSLYVFNVKYSYIIVITLTDQ